MYSISLGGYRGVGDLSGSAKWLARAVLVSHRHLLHCPPAVTPGLEEQTCHYEKIRREICLRVRVHVLIQA